MSRPSVHDPISKEYAIDQIEDIEHLRMVAHRMWEAFFAAHSQAAHVIQALVTDQGSCFNCEDCMTGYRDTGCEQWQAWQRKVDAGFGSL